MSSNLCWKPVKPEKHHYLDSDLKYILRDSDNEYGNPIQIVLTTDDIPYLQGIADTGNKSASELINAINKYEKVLLKEEWL